MKIYNFEDIAMKIHYKTAKGKETLEISVEEFLKMSVSELSALNIVSVNASLKEMQQIKEQTGQYTEQYAALQEQYGFTNTEKSGLGFLKSKSDRVEDYSDMLGNLDAFRQYQEHEASLRETLANNHQIELEDLQKAGNKRVAEEERLYSEKMIALTKEQQDIEARLSAQTTERENIDATIAEKQRQLEELQRQQADYDNQVQQRIDPQVLTQAYMQAVHTNFDTSISNIKDRAKGTIIINGEKKSLHKLWVTNRAPLDAKGRPMTNFDEKGKVIGKPHSYGFPDMKQVGMYGINYCTMSVISCIDGVDKKCGVDVLNTDAFEIKIDEENTQSITPFKSGWDSKRTGGRTGESLSHRPDTIMCAFSKTPYVSGAQIDEKRLLKRSDGSLAIDVCGKNGCTRKLDTKAIKLDGVSLKDVYEKGTLVTDEKTGEKYYSYSYKNGSQTEHVYLKDGDIICIDTPAGATNTTSGYHTIMVNIDQETGEMTYTAGNGDHVRADIKTSSYYNQPMSAFHTSEFAHDKIASFDEQTRITMAQNLGLLDGLDKSKEIAQLQAEIEELNKQRAAADANIKQTTADLATHNDLMSSEESAHHDRLASIAKEQQDMETNLKSNQNTENLALEESLKAAATSLFSGQSLDDVLKNILAIEPKQSEEVLSTQALTRLMSNDHSNAQGLMTTVLSSLTNQNVKEDVSFSRPIYEENTDSIAIKSVATRVFKGYNR